MQGENINSLSQHVLIIDDSPDLVESLRRLLEYYGCRVEVAHDGREGLRKAVERQPDVILIDIAMPGMTGYEVARAIRSTFSYKVVLIAQTAYGTNDDRAKAIASGFDEHLIKPAEPDRLIREIAAVRSPHD